MFGKRKDRTEIPVGELVTDHKAAAARLEREVGLGFKNCWCGATFLRHSSGDACPVCGRV
jgi:rubrerythrin